MFRKIVIITGLVITSLAFLLGLVGIISVWVGHPIDNINEYPIWRTYFFEFLLFCIVLNWVITIKKLWKI